MDRGLEHLWFVRTCILLGISFLTFGCAADSSPGTSGDGATAGEGATDGEEEEEGGGMFEMATDECASGRKWVGGNEESPLMRPGSDCVGCHRDEGEGPLYLAAGTVYEALDEPDDCYGLEGATVEVTDADGTVWMLTTNAAGNFFIEPGDGPLVFPFTAKVTYDGAELPMATAQSDGNCNTCHTQMGANLAAGRIYVP
jgi:hypothetical protein